MEDAAIAYDISSICLRGDKAQTNFDVSTYDTKSIRSVPFQQLVHDTRNKISCEPGGSAPAPPGGILPPHPPAGPRSDGGAGAEPPGGYGGIPPPAPPAPLELPAHKTIDEMIAEEEKSNYDEFLSFRKTERARRLLQHYYIDNFIMTDKDGKPYFRR